MKNRVAKFKIGIGGVKISGNAMRLHSDEKPGPNETLFEGFNSVENQVDAIVHNAAEKYIDGIKENVFEITRQWLDKNRERFFFLFGNMGTGKSFFCAKLFKVAQDTYNIYPPVIYSGQATYGATVNVENMLLVIAARLYRSVPEYAEYFKTCEIGEKDIGKLVEKVLIEPFEKNVPAKNVFIIIDGLDEYPRQDCIAFLDALTLYSGRLSSFVNIFFSSRSERDILSHLPPHTKDAEYDIEKQDASRRDCLAFIETNSVKLGLEISEDDKNSLVLKSNCCIKYLQCIFDDPDMVSSIKERNMIDELPNGLLAVYRELLTRYFPDEDVYRNDFLPLLEVICIAYRPLKVFELANILGYDIERTNAILRRAGTLIGYRSEFVNLYQSETLKLYLVDGINCPEKFLVHPGNGERRIFARISQLIDDNDLDTNDYIFSFAVDHLLDMAEKNNTDAWDVLFNFMAASYGQRDVIGNVCQIVLTRNKDIWKTFLRKLYATQSLTPVQKDALASSLQLAASAKHLLKTLIDDVVAKLPPSVDFRYLEMLFRSRYERNERDSEAKLVYAFNALEIIDSSDITEQLRNMRYSFIYDEIQRIKRYRGESHSDVAEYLAKLVEVSEKALELCDVHDCSRMILLRDVSVVYGQLGLFFEKLSGLNLTEAERVEVSKKLCDAAHISDEGAHDSDFFIRKAIYCRKKEYEITSELQNLDCDSKRSLHDVTFSLKALGRLYAKKDFKDRDLAKAIDYLEKSLSISEKVSEKAFSETTDTHPLVVKYACAPISVLDDLISVYCDDGNFDDILPYIQKWRFLAERVIDCFSKEQKDCLSQSLGIWWLLALEKQLVNKNEDDAMPLAVECCEMAIDLSIDIGDESLYDAIMFAHEQLNYILWQLTVFVRYLDENKTDENKQRLLKYAGLAFKILNIMSEYLPNDEFDRICLKKQTELKRIVEAYE